MINNDVPHSDYSQRRHFFKCNKFWASRSLTVGMEPRPGHFPFLAVPSVKRMRLATPKELTEPERVSCLGPVSSPYSLDFSFLSPDPVTCPAPSGQKGTSNTSRRPLRVKAQHPTMNLIKGQGLWLSLDLESGEEFVFAKQS